MSSNKESVAATVRRAGRPDVEVELRCSRFQEECRRRGMRVTAQRLAVYRTLAGDTSHPTAEGVYARLRLSLAGLSRATVYRILDSLEHEGFVRRVSTTDGIGRFDANLASHQHLVCRRCGRMIDMESETFESLSLPSGVPGDFLPERLDIRIIGTCGVCRRSKDVRNRF